MPFLPTTYAPPVTSGGDYLKLQDGDNRLRILSDAVVGYVYWTKDNKPSRSIDHPGEPMDIRIGDNGKPDPIRFFWVMVVWDYNDEKIKIWECTQRQIQSQIEGLYDDDDWGDPKNYDIKINKTGQKLDTKYHVKAVPAKPLASEIKEAYQDSAIDLNALFSGGNPFGSKSAPATHPDFEAFKTKLENASSLDDVDAAFAWVMSKRRIAGIIDAMGDTVTDKIETLNEFYAGKFEKGANSADFEDIPF